MSYNEALGKLREARAEILKEQGNGGGSRELSVALTNLETAILWKEKDIQVKRPPINIEKSNTKH